MFKRTVSAITAMVVLATLAVLMIGASPVFASLMQTVTLNPSITAAAHWTLDYKWTISKSVTPDTLNMFTGDQGTVIYNVVAQKETAAETAWIDGQVCITNSGGLATDNLAIQVVVGSTSIAVDLSSKPVLGAYETYCYPYHVDMPVLLGGYSVTANISGNNFAALSASTNADLPASPVVTNDSITVDDSNGSSWVFSASGSQSYSKTFTCDADKGAKVNTATIRETGQSASATVQVNCYGLKVTKTAETTFERKLLWEITKSVDTSSLTLAVGQSIPVNYVVKVNKYGFLDQNWFVKGTIKVENPAPMDAIINSVTDVISNGVGSVPVDCGVSFPFVLPAGQILTCTYSKNLPDPNPRVNTATATLQNTPSGTTDFSGTANISMADADGAIIKFVDTCVTVSDSNPAGPQNVTYCYHYTTNPQLFPYTAVIGPYATCGNYNVPNIATLVTNDTKTTASASANVAVNVPCVGCTLTIGYWKTHAGFGPQADMVTPLLPIWLGSSDGVKSVQVVDAGQAVYLLNMSGNASNGINKLYAQLLGAKLNLAKGASGSAVYNTIGLADNFLSNYNANDWAAMPKTQRSIVLSWVATLDKFNNGLIGPGHCSE